MLFRSPLLGFGTASFRVEGREQQGSEAPTAQAAGVTPDYFKTLGIRLLDGRTFTETDDGPNRVVVVDETMARMRTQLAGIVGEVAARIFGQTQEQTTAFAHKLGLAMQLTNIIRDVGEDARRGRVYLPAEELAVHGLTAEDILSLKDGPAFQAMMEIGRAHV